MNVGIDHHELLVLLVVLVAAAGLIAVATPLRVPYPILLVLGGLALGMLPGAPHVALDPAIALVGILPPLLYGAAFFTPLRELRANVRPIGLLAVGLVLATMCTVAAVAHTWIDSMTWSEAFVLGALVSPTDPTAATSIARRLGIPRRLVSVVEGESLVNDGTALVAYRFAVVAVVEGSFSLWSAAGSFVLTVAGGIAVGLAVGWCVRQVRRRLDNPPVEITISLLTGYFAYLPAEALGVSAVLAAVTVGIYMGWYTPELTTVQVRLQGDAVWNILMFVLNGLLFVLIGLQLPTLLDALDNVSLGRLVGWGALVAGTVIVTRLLWVYPGTYLPRLLSRRIRERDPFPSWKHPAVIGWAGMRGAVSLAAALALPLTIDGGAPFANRDLIVFLVFCTILGTLVLQGLTLPLLIRVLHLEDDGLADEEEIQARSRAAAAALARIDELEGEDWVRDDTAERLRGTYDFRRQRFSALSEDDDDGSIEERSRDYQRLRRELLEAERQAVRELRRDGVIDDDVLRRIEYDLDLEDARLG
jgi:CPA1 family monovalent cation:H+ antiporter